MADINLNSNLMACAADTLDGTQYCACYVNLVSLNATAGTSVIHILIALWLLYGSGSRTWSGAWVLYNSAGTGILSGNYSGTYANALNPVWVVNGNYTVSHGLSGNTWTGIYLLGFNVLCNTLNNGSVTHVHRNNWNRLGYTYAIVPAMTKNYYFDVNGWLDGTNYGNTSGMGTFDVTVGGTLRSNDTTDFYAAYPAGSSYSVSDIKTVAGKAYIGVVGGAISGTIASGSNVRLGFFTQTIWVYVNGWHRAIPWVYHNGWHRAWARVYNGGWKNCKT